MAKEGSEAAHDEKVAALLGDDADRVNAAAVAYPPLSVDRVEAALLAGKTCRIVTPAARLLVFSPAGTSRASAVVTELRHGGYRRAYRRIDTDSPAQLVAELVERYGLG